MTRIFHPRILMAATTSMVLTLGACAPSTSPRTLTVADAASGREVSDNAAAVRASEAKAAAANARASEASARARAASARAAAAEAKAECEKDRQQASNRGAVVGGVAGAILGTQVAGDVAKSEGGAIGAVGGVMAGRQLAKKDHRC